ncbi:NUMOD3 domain-containing DNA-binding protein [Sinorhizobium sp. BJ1]|uniref:NUMOD3 domain-containing DNA-binding protein n=1 Tax=Sinorhizobium sp. BJ1 TaxID=2035455 RepID=UPI000BE98B18|nr:NUMOD3 domain-containing DNA-binding protein [Sinorhizobium sp. BJ1]PDT79960.1 hypothetical protein CO676_30400 [Sinorhizobium sp. BJ1]
MSDFYVYAWLRPCGTPFYIGKGKGDRDRETKRANPHFKRIVDKIKRSGNEAIVIRVLENLDEDEAFELEKALIRSYGRKNNRTGILVNMTDGGEGPQGRAHSEESIAKMRLAHSNISEETRAKMSAAQKGKKLSEEHRDSISSGMIGRVLSDATRAKLSRSHTGKKMSSDARAKMSEGRRGVSLSQAHREKLSAAQVGKKNSPDAIAKMASAARLAPAKKGKFKGVNFQKSSGKWHAQLYLDGRNRHIGYFQAQEDAARAYDAAAFASFGFDCYLNFPAEIASNDNGGAGLASREAN